MCLKQRWTGCWRPKCLSTTGMVETPLSRLQTYVGGVDEVVGTCNQEAGLRMVNGTPRQVGNVQV